MPHSQRITCPSCQQSFGVRPSHAVWRKYCSRACKKAATQYGQFWSYVQKTEGCWLWTGHVDTGGYGSLKDGNRQILAHRHAYELTYGPFDKTLWVLHTCDTPRCVRPAHLYLGTAADNTRDAIERHRFHPEVAQQYLREHPELHARGERQHAARLTASLVREIRQQHAAGVTPPELERRFAMSSGAIWKVINYRSWKHVD